MRFDKGIGHQIDNMDSMRSQLDEWKSKYEAVKSENFSLKKIQNQ